MRITRATGLALRSVGAPTVFARGAAYAARGAAYAPRAGVALGVGCAFAAVFAGANVVGGCTYTQDFAGSPSDADAASPGNDLADGAACTSTDEDPSNCGACGHSCLGGTCHAGRCEAQVLAEGLGNSGTDGASTGPTSIVTDAKEAYWINGAAVLMHMPLDRGTPERFADLAKLAGSTATLIITPEAIIVGPGPMAAYSLVRVDRATRAITSLFDRATPVKSFAVAGNDLFVQSSRTGAASVVYRCPLTGCPTPLPSPLYTLTNANMDLDGIAAGDLGFFVSMFPNKADGAARLELHSRDTGELLTTIGATAPRYGAPIADGMTVFSSNFTYVIGTSFAPTGAKTAVFDKYIVSGNQVRVYDRRFTFDADYLYWAEAWGPRRVVRCSKKGCPEPEPLWVSEGGAGAKDFDGTGGAPDGAMSVSLSGDAVVFTTGDGKVMKLAKPASTKATR